MAKKFKVQLVRGLSGTTETQRETVRCLGLRKRGSTVMVNDTPANRGQIFKIQHLLEVTPVK